MPLNQEIRTVEDLREYLHVAMQLEHATIPPYLMALYTIRPGTNPDAVRILRVVAIEEMLHLTLAANLLNAVGGIPDLTAPGFVPQYPTCLPDGETDFEVGLGPFSRAAVETFLQIERTAQHSGTALLDVRRSERNLLPTVTAGRTVDRSRTGGEPSAVGLHYYSIGEFYQAITVGIERLHAERVAAGGTLFTGDPVRQAGSEHYYSGGGELTPVTDLDSALAAIRTISEQGEGLGGGIYDHEGELSHYYRFQQLLLGRYYLPGDEPGRPSGPALDVDWDGAYPVLPDARIEDYEPGTPLYVEVAALADRYQDFLSLLTDAFTGRPHLLVEAVGAMFRLRDRLLCVIRNPLPGHPGTHAAPVFRPVDRKALV